MRCKFTERSSFCGRAVIGSWIQNLQTTETLVFLNYMEHKLHTGCYYYYLLSKIYLALYILPCKTPVSVGILTYNDILDSDIYICLETY